MKKRLRHDLTRVRKDAQVFLRAYQRGDPKADELVTRVMRITGLRSEFVVIRFIRELAGE